jgi:tyrosine-protein phosphatase non-receptor type 9
MYKNRYRDVICLDESRVKLKSDSNQNGLEQPSNYIHANYVDGYKQKNAFINAQGPLDETVEDFWHMIWQECTLVIAMTTKVIEQKRLKCAQYWPLEMGQILRMENLFEIINTQVQNLGDYRVTKLIIKHLPVGLIVVIIMSFKTKY